MMVCGSDSPSVCAHRKMPKLGHQAKKAKCRTVFLFILKGYTLHMHRLSLEGLKALTRLPLEKQTLSIHTYPFVHVEKSLLPGVKMTHQLHKNPKLQKQNCPHSHPYHLKPPELFLTVEDKHGPLISCHQFLLISFRG